MKIFIQIIIDPENDQPTTTKNVAELKRESLSTDTLGLTLMESKAGGLFSFFHYSDPILVFPDI